MRPQAVTRTSRSWRGSRARTGAIELGPPAIPTRFRLSAGRDRKRVCIFDGSSTEYSESGENVKRRHFLAWSLVGFASAAAFVIGRQLKRGNGEGKHAALESILSAIDPPLSNDDAEHLGNLINGLVQDGVWDGLDAIWLLASPHEQAAKLNLRSPETLGISTVGSPRFYSKRGYLVDGKTQYLSTGWAPGGTTSYSRDSALIGVFAITPGTAAAHDFGTSRAQGSYVAAISGDKTSFAVNSEVEGVFDATFLPYPMLAVAVRRNLRTSHYRFGGGSGGLDVTTVGEPVSPDDETMVIGAAAGGYSDRVIGAAFVGRAPLDDSSVSAIYRRIRTYMTAIGADYSNEEHFADTIATQGWTRSSGTPAYFDRDTNTTWVYYESLNRTTRKLEARCKVYDHALGVVSDEVTISDRMLVDDSHGTPVGVKGPDGYHYAFYGSHNSLQLGSRTVNKGSSSSWVPVKMWEPVTKEDGNATYPHPAVVGRKLYMIIRLRRLKTRLPLGLVTADFEENGDLSWGNARYLVDLGDDSRVYMGITHVIDDEIHFVCCRANAADTERNHVYYFVYNTKTDEIRNFEGSVIFSSDSFPVGLDSANRDFRIYEHTTASVGTTPQSCFDEDGRPHVVFCVGSLQKAEIQHIWHDGKGWSQPRAIGTIGRTAQVAVYPLSEGEVAVAWGEDPDDYWPTGGRMVQRIWRRGTWAETEVLRAPVAYGLDSPFMVRDGHPDMRLVFGERAVSDEHESGFLKLYAHGARGFRAKMRTAT